VDTNTLVFRTDKLLQVNPGHLKWSILLCHHLMVGLFANIIPALTKFPRRGTLPNFALPSASKKKF